MTLNNVKAVGDDQAWKREAEAIIKELRSQVNILRAQVTTLSQKVNSQ